MNNLKIILGWKGEVLNPQEMNEAFQWLRGHLASPYKAKSSFPICRWAEKALLEDQFHLGDGRTFGKELEGLFLLIKEMVAVYKSFGAFESFKGKIPPSLTVLINREVSIENILRVLEKSRKQMTKEKIMIGALDPYNSVNSLKGGDKYPYRSPFIFFTIRFMVKGDIIFLNLNKKYKLIYDSTFLNN